MVQPGILPLQITRGISFNQLTLYCVSENVTVTGTLSPNVTGQFVLSGFYNGYQLFILEGSPSTFIYVNQAAASYVIAQTLTDAALTNYWLPASPILTDPSGTYLPQGGVTGTATATDSPTNLTGFTVKAQCRRNPGDEELILDFNPSVTDTVNGIITIPTIASSVTGALPYIGTFMWDLIFVDGSGNEDLIAIRGPVTISDKVTEP